MVNFQGLQLKRVLQLGTTPDSSVGVREVNVTCGHFEQDAVLFEILSAPVVYSEDQQ